MTLLNCALIRFPTELDFLFFHVRLLTISEPSIFFVVSTGRKMLITVIFMYNLHSDNFVLTTGTKIFDLRREAFLCPSEQKQFPFTEPVSARQSEQVKVSGGETCLLYRKRCSSVTSRKNPGKPETPHMWTAQIVNIKHNTHTHTHTHLLETMKTNTSQKVGQSDWVCVCVCVLIM